jgi:flagellar basal-body rod protein FlgG
MPILSLQALVNIARAGLLANQISTDVVANNISNINTDGYKQNRAEFQEMLSRQLQAPAAPNNRSSGQAEGVWLAATQRLFEQGQIVASDQPWDLAIEGEGFFQVQFSDGQPAYARNGNFRPDSQGRLVNPDGYLLSPVVTLPPDAEETHVNSDGNILVRRRGETEPRSVATINLVRFANSSGLEDIGDNLFRPTVSSGEAQVSPAKTNGMGQIIAFAQELSNVDLGQQITDLISAQRAYALMTRALSTADEMLNLANQLRA